MNKDSFVKSFNIYVDGNSRDILVASNAFLVMLQDGCEDPETKFRIQKIIDEITDMLYGPTE